MHASLIPLRIRSWIRTHTIDYSMVGGRRRSLKPRSHSLSLKSSPLLQFLTGRVVRETGLITIIIQHFRFHSTKASQHPFLHPRNNLHSDYPVINSTASPTWPVRSYLLDRVCQSTNATPSTRLIYGFDFDQPLPASSSTFHYCFKHRRRAKDCLPGSTCISGKRHWNAAQRRSKEALRSLPINLNTFLQNGVSLSTNP